MNTTFPHFYTALEWTIEYYEISRIKNEFERISGTGYGGANAKFVQDSYELVFELHDRMEQEIKHSIQNCYPAAQIIHLELLKSWLTDHRIQETNAVQVAYVINSYNDNLYEKFKKEIEDKEEVFKATFHYNLEQGAEYEIEVPDFSSIPRFFFSGLSPLKTKKVIKQNNRFFSAEPTPEYIDTKYFKQYINRLDKLVSNFNGILKKYVDLYNKGVLPATQTIVVVQQPVIEKTEQIKELPSPLAPPSKKLKIKLSVAELALLFRLLKDEGLIEGDNNKEIHEFLSKNFETHKAGKTASISKLKLEGSFSSPHSSTGKSLGKKLKEMWSKAINI